MNIGFLVPWPLNADLTSYWVLWASVATAIGTGLLAWFAWFAWQSAKETLKGQQNAIELEALGKYVRALNALARMSPSAPASYIRPSDGRGSFVTETSNAFTSYKEYVNDLCHEVEVAGAMWRVHHRVIDTYQSAFYLSESRLISAQQARIRIHQEEEKLTMENLQKYSDDMVYWVKTYQTRSEDRASLARYVSKQYATRLPEPSEN